MKSPASNWVKATPWTKARSSPLAVTSIRVLVAPEALILSCAKAEPTGETEEIDTVLEVAFLVDAVAAAALGCRRSPSPPSRAKPTGS